MTDRSSIPDIVKAMSLEEKATLLIGASFFRTRELDQFGIPEVYFLDGGTGANLGE